MRFFFWSESLDLPKAHISKKYVTKNISAGQNTHTHSVEGWQGFIGSVCQILGYAKFQGLISKKTAWTSDASPQNFGPYA